MRVEPYTIDSYLHIVKRGARGLDIVRDESDRWRFLRLLYYMNDELLDLNWSRNTRNKLFERPPQWPVRQPLIDILAYTLMPNHFHLIVREIRKGGVSKFMQKIGQGTTNYINKKYEEQGSVFQGAYRSRTIGSDNYFRYVAAYVMVKNTFELYPHGGLKSAQQSFDAAWNWAINYPFSSIGDYAGVRKESPILSKGLLGELFTPKSFKSYAKDVILGGKWAEKEKELE